jgi:hypothetical protein
VPDSVLWAILGALFGWLGKAQLERLKVTEAYRTEQAARRVEAQVEVWKRLDLSIYYTSYYFEALLGLNPDDDATRKLLNARSMKAKEVHDRFEVALHEQRLVLGDDFKRLNAIHNRMAELDRLFIQRPIDVKSVKAHVEAIQTERDNLAAIVKKSLRW